MKETKRKLNILFVCRYNRFRSRVAEAYFNKINKNKNVKVKSAGLIKGNALEKRTVRLAREMNLDIRGKTQGLTSKILRWQNVTVVVADDVPPSVFDRNKVYGKKVIVWKIKDIKGNNKNEISTIKSIKEIIKKSDKLRKDIESRRIK